jgi:hypothetical protein
MRRHSSDCNGYDPKAEEGEQFTFATHKLALRSSLATGIVSSPEILDGEEAGSGEGTDGTDPPVDRADDPRSRRSSLQRSKHVYVYSFLFAIGCGL